MLNLPQNKCKNNKVIIENTKKNKKEIIKTKQLTINNML